jgi:hypothetical protein
MQEKKEKIKNALLVATKLGLVSNATRPKNKQCTARAEVIQGKKSWSKLSSSVDVRKRKVVSTILLHISCFLSKPIWSISTS